MSPVRSVTYVSGRTSNTCRLPVPLKTPLGSGRAKITNCPGDRASASQPQSRFGFYCPGLLHQSTVSNPFSCFVVPGAPKAWKPVNKRSLSKLKLWRPKNGNRSSNRCRGATASSLPVLASGRPVEPTPGRQFKKIEELLNRDCGLRMISRGR
jgi:hypothetical protein